MRSIREQIEWMWLKWKHKTRDPTETLTLNDMSNSTVPIKTLPADSIQRRSGSVVDRSLLGTRLR